MALWFSRDRSQAASVMTDDQHVDDASQGSEAQARALDALRAETESTAGTPDDVLDIWRLHEAAVEAEYHTHRFIGGGQARRQLREALIAEADALHKLGFDSFAMFAAAHGWKRPQELAADPGLARDAEATERITELLGQLGVDAGEDPLETAKEFLANVEHTGLTESTAVTPRPPAAPVATSIDLTDGTPMIAPEDRPHLVQSEEDERERADARAQRIHAELERVTLELAASAAERDAAERAVEAARRELGPLREELVTLQQSIETNANDLRTRIIERDSALAARRALEEELGAARDEIERLAVLAEAQTVERDLVVAEQALTRARVEELEASLDEFARRNVDLDRTIATLEAERDEARRDAELARAEIARIESVLAAHEAERALMQQQVLDARAETEELVARLEGTQSTLDALAAHAEEVEAELAATREAAAARVPQSPPQPAPREELSGLASSLVDQARADADALRQQAMREAEAIRRDALVTADGIRRIAHEDARDLRARLTEAALTERERDDRLGALVDRVSRMERKLAKQRRRLEKTVDRLESMRREERKGRHAADVLSQAERDAEQIRRAAAVQRQRARDELIALLARLVGDDSGSL